MESIEELRARVQLEVDKERRELDREFEERLERMLEHGRRTYRDGYQAAVRHLTYALQLDPTKEDFEAWLKASEEWHERGHGRERCGDEAPPDLETVVRGRFPFAPRVAPAAAERVP